METWERQARPLNIPTYQEALTRLDMTGTIPAACCGYRMEGIELNKPWRCSKPAWCAFCYWRRMHAAGLRNLLIHGESENVVQFTVDLPLIRHSPRLMAEARKALFDHMRRYRGFNRFTMNIQFYGDDPTTGLDLHMDCFASGPTRADVAVFDIEHTGKLLEVLEPWSLRPGSSRLNIEIEHRVLDGHQSQVLKEVMVGGMMSGRLSFPTARVLAGLYGTTDDLRVRYTNVFRGIRLDAVQDHPTTTGNGHWTHAELLDAQLQTARLAKLGRGIWSRSPRISYDTLEKIQKLTPWRFQYRLPCDSKLADTVLEL